VATDGFNTLSLADGARAILKGGESLSLRTPSAASAALTGSKGSRQRDRAAKSTATSAALADLSAEQLQALATLKAWRATVAKAHNLPAFIIFHDSTLLALAVRQPQNLADLQGVPGVGQKKREAYGPQVLTALGVSGFADISP
jgi:ATP-dependent DNA helicase RecQ